MYIYKITNTVNNKIYIGQTTKTIEERFEKHWQEAKCSHNGNRPENYFHNALVKYGKKNFKIEQIDVCSSLDELNKKEEYWINFYNSTNKLIGYNLMLGGKSGIKSQETREKIGLKKKENWKDPILSQKMREGLKKATETWIQNCEEQKIEITCHCCGKKIKLAPHEASIRKYCSNECANKINISIATKVAAEKKKQQTQNRNENFKKEVLQWCKKNKELVLKCPKNKISSTLNGIEEIAKNNYNISDWRSISFAICGSASKKELLNYLQEFSENIC